MRAFRAHPTHIPMRLAAPGAAIDNVQVIERLISALNSTGMCGTQWFGGMVDE
ncbi:hypothetical protein [Parasphingorhabdus halotolerans]|uniref:hypothetical protein n=1 Tax=Parasphingorhabdus halotolerans TaxID=2725558 RepID=UPI001B3A25EC|nr:hypothetical protein [Parasphingorhabdus halotolerans]